MRINPSVPILVDFSPFLTAIILEPKLLFHADAGDISDFLSLCLHWKKHE